MSARIKRYERNPLGRDLIVGDIHGHFTRLQSALNAVAFDPFRDRLFSVGDLVDRGPESKDVLSWLDKPWFHAVQGNHEDMAIRWGMPDCRMDRGNYAANGGSWNIANTPEERAEFSHALRVLPVAIELETEHGPLGIVHASCPCASWAEFAEALTTGWVRTPTGLRNSKSAMDDLIDGALWSRSRIQAMDDSMVEGVRAVVVGHTPMQRTTSLGNTIFIDTGGWMPRGAGFTILDAATLNAVTIPHTVESLHWEDA